MPFPTTGILDNFNRANEGPPPSANWTNWSNGLKVVSSQCKGNVASQPNVSYWNPATFGPDSEVYITVLGAASEWFEIYARFNAPGTNGYSLFISTNAGAVRFNKYINGSPTQIGSDISTAIAAGDAFGLEIIGNSLKAYRKPAGGSWGQIGTAQTDSTYTGAGYMGCGLLSTNNMIDDFGGGTVVVAGDQVPYNRIMVWGPILAQ